MNPILGRWNAQVYAIFRIVAGLMFAMHGTQKLFSFPPSEMGKPAVGSLPWISGAIELVCGLAIAIGLLTSLAAFLASGEMAVAYFMVHAKGGFWPIVNKGELAVLYCFVFLFIAAEGAGIWAVDRPRGARR